MVDERILRLSENVPDLEVISGGARGADARVRVACREYGVEFTEYPADWEHHGKSAGFERNQQLVDLADMVIAFWDGVSPGTKHTINLALGARKSLEVHFP